MHIPQGVEKETRYTVIGYGWKEAAHTAASVTQYYLPHVNEKSIKLQIKLINKSGQVVVLLPDKKMLCELPLSEEALDKFGRHNLPHITEEDGTVPISDTVEARIRWQNDAISMAVKADTATAGERYKFVFEVTPQFANLLVPYCPNYVKKRHYVVPAPDNENVVPAPDNEKWEVNCYEGKNAGLITAEIEHTNTGRHPTKPPWVGQDVTSNPDYTNRSLAQRPYTTWGVSQENAGIA